MTDERRPVRLRCVDRIFDRRPVVRRAVMRCSDQQRNVTPTVCVRSGEKTDHAMPVRAVDTPHANASVIAIGQAATIAIGRIRRRPIFTVTVPVAQPTWRRWQGRLRISVVVAAMGAALLLVGAIRGIGTLVVSGIVMLALGWLNRVRAWHDAWVGVEYRAATAEVVVTRVHSAFDAEAKEIYRRSIMRR